MREKRLTTLFSHQNVHSVLYQPWQGTFQRGSSMNETKLYHTKSYPVTLHMGICRNWKTDGNHGSDVESSSKRQKKFVFVDETHWDIGNWCTHSWPPKGEKTLPQNSFQRTKLTSVAVITSLEETQTQAFKGTVTSTFFRIFSYTINWYSSVSSYKVVLNLDNVPSKNLKELLKKQVTIAFGTKISPKMNPIEFIFGVWKKQADRATLWQELSENHTVQVITGSFYCLNEKKLRAAVSYAFVKAYKQMLGGEHIWNNPFIAAVECLPSFSPCKVNPFTFTHKSSLFSFKTSFNQSKGFAKQKFIFFFSNSIVVTNLWISLFLFCQHSKAVMWVIHHIHFLLPKRYFSHVQTTHFLTSIVSHHKKNMKNWERLSQFMFCFFSFDLLTVFWKISSLKTQPTELTPPWRWERMENQERRLRMDDCLS